MKRLGILLQQKKINRHPRKRTHCLKMDGRHRDTVPFFSMNKRKRWAMREIDGKPVMWVQDDTQQSYRRSISVVGRLYNASRKQKVSLPDTFDTHFVVYKDIPTSRSIMKRKGHPNIERISGESRCRNTRRRELLRDQSVYEV
jgi:hypothetical protein